MTPESQVRIIMRMVIASALVGLMLSQAGAQSTPNVFHVYEKDLGAYGERVCQSVPLSARCQDEVKMAVGLAKYGQTDAGKEGRATTDVVWRELDLQVQDLRKKYGN